jgi:hypothetical protein
MAGGQVACSCSRLVYGGLALQRLLLSLCVVLPRTEGLASQGFHAEALHGAHSAPGALMRLLCALCCRLAETRSAGVLPVQKPYGQVQQGRLADQQRNIRMGW